MLNRKKIAVIEIGVPDMEFHVCTVAVEGQRVLDLRQFVPSLGEYSRGVTLPLAAKDDIVAALQKVK